MTKRQCIAHFANGRGDIVTTDASGTGLGITLWQKQTDNTFPPKALASRTLNDVETNCSMAEFGIIAALRRLENFRFYLKGKLVPLYADHQTLEPLIKITEPKIPRTTKEMARKTNAIQKIKKIQNTEPTKIKYYGLFEQNPNWRTLNRGNLRKRKCYQ